MNPERELSEDELTLVSGGTVSLSYGAIQFDYGKQSGPGVRPEETVTIWGIVMSLPPPK